MSCLAGHAVQALPLPLFVAADSPRVLEPLAGSAGEQAYSRVPFGWWVTAGPHPCGEGCVLLLQRSQGLRCLRPWAVTQDPPGCQPVPVSALSLGSFFLRKQLWGGECCV